MKSFNRNYTHSTSCTCISNHGHQSREEAEYCNILLFMKKAKEIKDYSVQYGVDLTVNGKTICRHIVDFRVENNDGSIEMYEYKGFPTAIWDLKRKLFEALYPDIKYNIKTKKDLMPYRSRRQYGR